MASSQAPSAHYAEKPSGVADFAFYSFVDFFEAVLVSNLTGSSATEWENGPHVHNLPCIHRVLWGCILTAGAHDFLQLCDALMFALFFSNTCEYTFFLGRITGGQCKGFFWCRFAGSVKYSLFGVFTLIIAIVPGACPKLG